MLNGTFFGSLFPYIRSVGRVLDVARYDLSVTEAKGSVPYPV